MLSWSQSSSLAWMQRERAWVEVNTAAIAHNVRQIQGLLSRRTELMAIVKADAYGHGATIVAETALQAGAQWLGVATLPEGIELREAGITAPVLVLGAVNTPKEIQAIAQWQLQPTLCTPKQALTFAETLTHFSRSAPLPVHLKLDTGMSRLGTADPDAAQFVQLVQRLPNLAIASVYSHLATAEDLDRTTALDQQKRFERAIAQIKAAGVIPPRLHLANSAAALMDAGWHYDLVRAGLAIYGLYPAEHLRAVVDLQPALQVRARVTQVKTIQPGTGVSYGHQFVADRTLRVAVVGIGYADGVPRNLSSRIEVLVRGQRVRQIGAITMDQLMLDVSAVSDLQEGEVVTLLGRDGPQSIGADEWAVLLGTISWEILCGFKHRLPRISVNSVSPEMLQREL